MDIISNQDAILPNVSMKIIKCVKLLYIIINKNIWLKNKNYTDIIIYLIYINKILKILILEAELFYYYKINIIIINNNVNNDYFNFEIK